ncbi:MAG TPA: hypothetical protein VFB25_08585 [Gaiellaceae bacterium]|nr:hypothetical protein [Gaiellaceae bacterium]
MRERTTLDRFLAAIPVAIVALALLSLYFWEASARKTPTIFSDELEWSQISRAIATTGHAARRGQPISFKSLYAFMLAPVWWIHSTKTAYTVAKYVDTVVMCLAAIPAYLTARLMVSHRAALIAAFGSICTSALFFGGYLLPETLAYPYFVLCAYASIRALAGGGRRWIVAAVVLDLVAKEVRNELLIALTAFILAAVVLWIVGPQGQRLRAGWSRLDHAGAAVLLIGALIVLNALASPHVSQWNYVTHGYVHRMWTLGLESFSALALGLGVLPLIAGLASLWLPERTRDPSWRAFASFTASAILIAGLYTALKAAYLSTQAFTRVEERNLIYLGPLLIIGAVVYFSSRRPWLPAALAAAAVTWWITIHYGYQLAYPYFDSPGYGIATLANRWLRWDQGQIRLGLVVVCAVMTAAVLMPFARRVPRLASAGALAFVALATATLMLAGEITSAQGAAVGSRQYYDNLVQPPWWVDNAVHGQGVTFMGQALTQGDDLGVNLYEFWNRSLKNIWSLDGSAPPPGPVTTPDLLRTNGVLSNDPGLPYVLETSAVDIVGKVVASQPGLTLVRVTHPWRLRQATYGVASDGWVSGANGDATTADAAYAYFDRAAGRGSLVIDINRNTFCPQPSSPGTNVTVRVGPVALNEQRAPIVTHPTHIYRFHLADCSHRTFTVSALPPVAVQVHIDGLALGTAYGVSDSRLFGAGVGFAFTPQRHQR